jgi:glutamate--cysteine ligase
VSVNSLAEYLHDLRRAIKAPHAPFAALGVVRDGEYQQLSANALQIENEYYSYVRPKRTPRAGERTSVALARAGVEYLEVRALDNSAFDPVGTNARKLYFLEALLILLLFKDSPPIDADEEQAIERNHLALARRGREPGLRLERHGRQVPMRDWAAELLDSLQGICELLDSGQAKRPYWAALQDQQLKLQDVEHTPSARLLRELRDNEESFAALALRFSREHKKTLLDAPPATIARTSEFEAEVQESWREYAAIETARHGSFEDYLAAYLAD